MAFDAYARYYDLIYRDKDYEAESRYVASCIRRQSPAATRILELGCGSGGHAEHLASLGFTVHGVDTSEAMVARAEARRAALPSELAARLSFSLGDMRAVRTGETYDAVVSLFNVIGYQTANDEVSAAFATAAAHLRPGGVFLFDFWYGPALLTQKPEVRVKRVENEAIKVTRIAEPVMRPNDNVVDVNFTVLVEDRATGRIHQVQETHTVRYFFLPELTRYHGELFQEYASHAWMSTEPLDTRSWNGVQLLLRR